MPKMVLTDSTPVFCIKPLITTVCVVPKKRFFPTYTLLCVFHQGKYTIRVSMVMGKLCTLPVFKSCKYCKSYVFNKTDTWYITTLSTVITSLILHLTFCYDCWLSNSRTVNVKQLVCTERFYWLVMFRVDSVWYPTYMSEARVNTRSDCGSNFRWLQYPCYFVLWLCSKCRHWVVTCNTSILG